MKQTLLAAVPGHKPHDPRCPCLKVFQPLGAQPRAGLETNERVLPNHPQFVAAKLLKAASMYFIGCSQHAVFGTVHACVLKFRFFSGALSHRMCAANGKVSGANLQIQSNAEVARQREGCQGVVHCEVSNLSVFLGCGKRSAML